MAVPSTTRRIERETEAYKEAVAQSRIFYRRSLARALTRDVITSAITAGVSTMWSKADISRFACDVAEQVTARLQQVEEAELHVH